MTKCLKSWRIRLANYLQKTEKETEFKDKKTLIMSLLKKDLSIEESVNLFSSVSSVFVGKMKEQLEKVSREKEVLEQFLNK
jgi:hypothetical protein